MPFLDSQNSNIQGADTPLAVQDQQQPSQSAQDTPPPQFQAPPATTTPAPTTPSSAPVTQAMQQQSPQTKQTQIVANTQPVDVHQDHPLVRKASVLRSVAETLAGGPRYTERIDENGNRVLTPVKMTGKDIAMAIALEAIQGSLTGLAAGRGHGAGAAGAAAFQQSAGMRLQEQQRQDERAQQDAQNRAAVLTRKAQIAEVNSRTLLNTAEAEKYGADAIDRLVEINRSSGVLDIDPSNLDNGGQPMTQAELMDAMKSGKLSAMDQLGPVTGRVQVTNADGSTRWEATHLVVKDPNQEVPITQEMWDRFADAQVPGFKKGIKIAEGVNTFKLGTIQRANEVAGAHALGDFRLKELREVLNGTPWSEKVPASIDYSQPGVDTALQKFQKYISHSNQHGMDVYESLQQMGADKRDSKTGAMQPNPDAKYVDAVAAAFGGWGVLEAVHNQLGANKKIASEFGIVDSEAKANAVLASPGKFTKDQVDSAQRFLSLAQQQGAGKAAQEARERAVAEGKDVEAMLKTGINPITGERLSLANAPDSMLVDAKGRPIPQNQQPLYKPSQNERQTADTARQALAISADLRAAVQKNPNLVGPLLGNSKKALSKLGLGDAEAQKLIDDVNFLQSAATKVHTGRFSSEILKKMSGMIAPGMNSDQFIGGLNSIDEVMGRYAKEDQLITVADYKQMQTPASVPNAQTPPASLLKEGVNTTFANGQTWTLRNGQPVQVK
jgi:hypothetical protein